MVSPVGFLQESSGVSSASRLIAALFSVGALVLSLAAAYVAFRGAADSGAIIAALSAPMTALAGGAWGALKERSTDA